MSLLIDSSQALISGTGGRTSAVTSNAQMWIATFAIGTDAIDMRYSNDDGLTWGVDTDAAIPNVGIVFSFGLFIDLNDIIYMTWIDTSDRVMLQRGTISGNTITWGTQETIYTGGASPLATDMVAFEFAGNDYAVVTYQDENDNLLLEIFQWTGSVWSSKKQLTLQTGNVGFHMIDFHHNGDTKSVKSGQPDIYVVWTDTTANDLYWQRLDWDTGTTWNDGTKRTMFNGTASLGSHTAMRFDGTRCIMCCLDNDNSELKVYERDAADTTTVERTPASLFGDHDDFNHDIHIGFDKASQNIILMPRMNASFFPGYAIYDRDGDSWPDDYTQLHAAISANWQVFENKGGSANGSLFIVFTTDDDLRLETLYSTALGGGFGVVPI